jgi:multiple sugar transport system permease protein
MVIFLAGLQNVSPSLLEAAQIDGANKWETFRNVTLPLLSPTTFFLLIMSLISSFQVFDQAFVMTSGGPGRASYTMVYHVYRLAFEQFTFGVSSAAGGHDLPALRAEALGALRGLRLARDGALVNEMMATCSWDR